MKCPNDGNDLESKTFKKVKVHECSKCDGLWFDRDELRRAKDSTDEDLRWLDFDIFEEKGNKYSKNDSHKHCPKDSVDLKTLTYSGSKVSIETCPRCEGIWLDHDEFKKIIDYLEKIVVTDTSGDYAKETLNAFVEILNGPEDSASEIKDFLSVLKLADMRLGAEHPHITYALINFPIR